MEILQNVIMLFRSAFKSPILSIAFYYFNFEMQNFVSLRFLSNICSVLLHLIHEKNGKREVGYNQCILLESVKTSHWTSIIYILLIYVDKN
jgi:Trk-type K+ transport system membrane component